MKCGRAIDSFSKFKAIQKEGSVLFICSVCVRVGDAESKEGEEMVIDGFKGFKFGCDPELFVVDENGVGVSAAGLIPGTKEEPHKVEGGAVQVDGMAAEFNIDPVESFKDFDKNITIVLEQLTAMLPTGLTLVAKPAIVFPENVFNAAPEIAKELGCSPDFNAWTGEMNPLPQFLDNPYLRTASGHIHIGWTDDVPISDPQHVMNCRDLVKQFDWYLGAWSLKWDADPVRRLLYGRAGACRYKTYGVEYRVLSNFWVTNKARRLDVWNRMQLAIRAMASSPLYEKAPKAYQDMVQASINTSKMDKALSNEFTYPIRTVDASYARY